ncbi:MAG TPA: isoprenylcysteine carboxylmethyltransferase family protein [Caldimonas sp.]|jgi:protein-S-isoprenylcysteine O-methyltransferase Ste14|nr:isoprenylcysteine carboxylmethyltransferase family protein [Caldimonas sp.]HEX4236186.1 isoprenylcysteine carboxylmethyltransferase family protein [Caldimonas sp.]
MPDAANAVIAALWLGWVAYWTIASIAVKASVRRESIASRLLHVVPLAVAVLLLWPRTLPIAALRLRFVPAAAWLPWAGATLVAAGLLFTLWARLHLGRNWSGIVTIKQGHELITGGPYAFVRHPIYSGLLLAFAGWAIATGEWRGVLAVVIVAAAFWRKVRVEECWLHEQFGGTYDAYRQRVAALVPFVF